jgi:recombinase
VQRAGVALDELVLKFDAQNRVQFELVRRSFGALGGEEAIRAAARELRARGLLLRAIASALEERGLHPRRAKAWSPEMVRRLMSEAA